MFKWLRSLFKPYEIVVEVTIVREMPLVYMISAIQALQDAIRTSGKPDLVERTNNLLDDLSSLDTERVAAVKEFRELTTAVYGKPTTEKTVLV